MAVETLYHHGLVVASIGSATEDECQARVIAAIELIAGVYKAERIPHMVAMDNVGEVSIAVFIEQGADFVVLDQEITKISGVTYKDVAKDNDLVRLPSTQPAVPCGQPGHQCVCETAAPKPV